MDKGKALETIDEAALSSAALWLQSCPEIVLGGIKAQLLGGTCAAITAAAGGLLAVFLGHAA